ncbi:MAG: DNA translocase FtsK 4TM domain-containing protein [Candidatus Paceibacterota bacterium]
MANKKGKEVKINHVKNNKDNQMTLKLPSPFDSLKSEVKRGIASIFMFCLMIIFVLSAFTKAGVAGSFIFDIFYKMFGIGYYLIPICFLFFGVHLLKSRREANPHY